MGEPGWQVLADALRHHAERDPGRLAFATRDAQLSYGDLAERAGSRAGALRARGVGPGDRVALTMPAGLALVEVLWALQLLGATPCVINPSLPGPTLQRRLGLIRPKLVVTEAAANDMPVHRPAPDDSPSNPDDIAFLQLTSGTTGEPRASMILHRNVLTYLQTSRCDTYLGPDDVLVSWVPPWHDFGLVRFVLAPVIHGQSCHIVEPAVRTIPEWLATIARVGGTYSAGPDFAFRLAVRMVPRDTVDLSSLRLMKSGGEPVRRSSLSAFEQHFSISGVTVPGYGLGEATLGVSEHLPGEALGFDEHGNVSCGLVNPDLEVQAGSSLVAPEEIRVRGATVFAGYLDAPEETARVLRDGWLHTGDSGYFDEQDRLFVLGRRAGLIKRAGSVIAPRELEEAAQQVAGVRLAAAVGLPSRGDSTDRIVVAVEATASEERPVETIARLVSDAVRASVGFAPSDVHVMPPRSIPLTENGKVRHALLRSRLEVTARGH